MIWVGFEHETVSGSDPGNRHDLDRLLERKRNENDYDVLLLWDRARFTRAGAKHAAWLEVEFGRQGVKVVSMTSKGTGSRFDWVGDGIEDEAAYDYVVKLSRNKTRGRQAKVESGIIAYTSTPAFAIDRLYVNADDQPLHIIRNLRDGRQERLHHETREVLETYPAERKGSPKRHFRKQKTDKVILIPGAVEDVEMIRFMFDCYYVLGHGYRTTGLLMDAKGWRTASGKRWSQRSVEKAIHSTIYTGRGIANMWATGKFHNGKAGEPHEVQYDLYEMMNQKRRRRKLRAPEDWTIKVYPKLFSMLGDNLREKVWERQKDYLTKKATGQLPSPKRDKHSSSLFFLKQILKCKQNGNGLVGKVGSNKTRYYTLSDNTNWPNPGLPWLGRLVPAAPVESAVKAILTETLTTTDFTALIRKVVEEEAERLDKSLFEIGNCEKEQRSLDNQITFAISSLGELGPEAVSNLMAPLKERRRATALRLSQLRAAEQRGRVDVNQTVEAIESDLKELSASITGMEPQLLRGLLSEFMSVEIDMEKWEIDLDVRLPSWAAGGEKRILDIVGSLAPPTRRQGEGATHVLTSFKCLLSKGKPGIRRKPCITCSRKAA